MHLVINKVTIGPIIASVGLIVACYIKVASANSWSNDLEMLAGATLSWLTFLFTDTVVEFLEDDKPHAEWFQAPNTWVKVGAGFSLVVFTAILYGVI